MSYSGSGRVMNMLKREKSLKRTNSWSLLFGGLVVDGGVKVRLVDGPNLIPIQTGWCLRTHPRMMR